jgi:hypothetical protein
MVLLVALLAIGSLIWGAASYVSPSVLGLASAVIAAWLLAFVVRERIAKARRHTTHTQEG